MVLLISNIHITNKDFFNVPNDKNGLFVSVFNTICEAKTCCGGRAGRDLSKAPWPTNQSRSRAPEGKKPNHSHLSLPEFRTSQRKMEYVCFVSSRLTLSVTTLILCDSLISPLVRQGNQPHSCPQKGKEGEDVRLASKRKGRQEHLEEHHLYPRLRTCLHCCREGR